MRIVKFCPLLLAATTLFFTTPRLAAWDGTNSAARNANLELARQLNQAFVQVADEVSPVVVVITVTQKASATPQVDSGDDSNDGTDPLDRLPPDVRRWFRQHEQSAPPEKTRGQGSGIIIRKDGYILTNRHVVEDAETIEVRLKDGRIFPATVRGVDAPSDVAVVKIEASDLPVAKLADSSKTRVGEFAIAIGAPFALDYSVTFGHVSAKDRSNIIPSDDQGEASMTDQNFIQTDANINPGNSGGPLINIEGEVIGINTLIRGLRTGIGFAIPINLAKEVADKLITEGKFTRSWLGIVILSYRDYSGFNDLVKGVQDGVVVKEIAADGPASKSGLHPGDIITAIDGKTVVTDQQLKDEIRSKRIGQPVTLSVFRKVKDEGRLIKILVKPGEWKDSPPASGAADVAAAEDYSSANLGLTVEAMTRDRASQMGVAMTEGVIVTRVEPGTLAGDSGIKRGDVITSVNQQPINNPKQFNDILKAADTKKGVIINLISQGAARFEILKENSQN
jgi:serine protease Do